jgi:glycerol uptake facilitator protein
MSPFFGELIGTGMLVILGQGVVQNVVLSKTKGHNSGWIVISFGWAIGVFVGVYCATPFSKAHLNPAVTLAFAALGKFPWADVPTYMGAQLLGAMAGSLIAWLAYFGHYKETEDAAAKLASFSTAPAIRNTGQNLLTEIIGTFALVFGVLYMASPTSSLGALDAFPRKGSSDWGYAWIPVLGPLIGGLLAAGLFKLL